MRCPEGGALIVYEAIIDDERRENAFGLLMSLNMLIETPGGFDYTGADGQGWMARRDSARPTSSTRGLRSLGFESSTTFRRFSTRFAPPPYLPPHLLLSFLPSRR